MAMKPKTDFVALVVIAQAVHKCGDHKMELAARRLLLQDHGVHLRFVRSETTKEAK